MRCLNLFDNPALIQNIAPCQLLSRGDVIAHDTDQGNGIPHGEMLWSGSRGCCLYRKEEWRLQKSNLS